MTTNMLTAARLQNLKPPASGFLELRDKLARGLSLRVFPTGCASWTFRYRPKDGGARTRIVIGEFPNIALATRDRADRMRVVVSGGGNRTHHRLRSASFAALREEQHEQCHAC